ncbi:MAG: EscU/YscU/HrcU family type III secretion system export apparatus switch protein [bacterium]|nr:EscU/YscU/HrcU family type III secretion system export apparatus switch protein [bacterium]
MNRKRYRSKKAVALRYDRERQGAPRIVAKGAGVMADKILEAARAHGVPIEENRDLVEMLSFFETGQEIPEEAYRAVAEILAFIYGIAGEHGASS